MYINNSWFLCKVLSVLLGESRCQAGAEGRTSPWSKMILPRQQAGMDPAAPLMGGGWHRAGPTSLCLPSALPRGIDGGVAKAQDPRAAFVG